jgi:hypothetical protein
MLSKEKIISNMIATLCELQAMEIHAENADYKVDINLYNSLCYKLKTYAEILDNDIPEEFIAQIEYFVEI